MVGETIVLIPGLMNDAWVWREQLAALSRLGPVIVACNDGCDDLAQMAERIAAATRGPMFVVGHSMGGRVALELAARAPERIARLALLSTGAHGPKPDEADGRLRLVGLAREKGMDAVAQAWLPDMMGPYASDAAREGVRSMVCRSTPMTFAAQQHALLTRADRTPMLPTIAVPTLIATGEHDGWASPAQHAGMAGLIPGASLRIVASAGHMLPVEASDELTGLLTSFFAEK